MHFPGNVSYTLPTLLQKEWTQGKEGNMISVNKKKTGPVLEVKFLFGKEVLKLKHHLYS